jgi:capsular polysaccharide transport system permease protein
MPPLATSHSSPATHNEPATASLWDSFRTQLRVIGALLMREILTRYGRKNIGFLWLFIDPMIFSLSIAFVWTQIHLRHFQTIPVFAFVLVSYSTVALWRRTTSVCMSAIEPNKSLLYHRHITVLDFYISRSLLEDAGSTMAFVMLVLFFAMVGMMPLPVDPLQVAAGWFLLAWFGFGLALTVGSVVHRVPLIQKAWRPLSLILFLCSAVVFPMDAAPAQAREILLWLPLVSGIEYLREGYFGPVISYYYDVFYMVACNLILTIAGLISVRLLDNRTIAD